ncbi:MAG: hypothetical protein AB7T06_07250 [Kofleriaceae bacterium]
MELVHARTIVSFDRGPHFFSEPPVALDDQPGDLLGLVDTRMASDLLLEVLGRMQRGLRSLAIVIHVRVVPSEHRVRLVHVLLAGHCRSVMAGVLRAIEACNLVFCCPDPSERDDHHDEREAEQQENESESTGDAASSRSWSTGRGHVSRS